MTEENERLDPEEIGDIASTLFKTDIERRVVTDDDGSKWELTTETKKTMTPNGEIISDKTANVGIFMSCGHQVTDPRQIMRCFHDGNTGHAVCRDCIIRCDGQGELICIYHFYEYEHEGRILRLCHDCAETYELYLKRENTITKKAFKFIKEWLEGRNSDEP